ncbi:MAG: hypothetical protein [Olavius algarvensis Gamma 1 endosymbiont]|nr:MAG: hypothetical protein [Olavius algarvensis Gamma 1 endosymbiont]
MKFINIRELSTGTSLTYNHSHQHSQTSGKIDKFLVKNTICFRGNQDGNVAD